MGSSSAFHESFCWPAFDLLWEDDGGEVHTIPQGEGGEQGNPLMPLLFCPTCPASLGDSVSLDWSTRLCHINGVRFSCLCRTIWVSACCAGRSRMWSPASESFVAVSHCMSLASPAVSRHGDNRARSAISPSLTSRGLRVCRRPPCFVGA